MAISTHAMTRDDRAPSLDVQAIRRDFPILHTRMNGKPLVYLDNAATTQKPAVVIDALRHYYEHENANIHRGVYKLSQDATEAYDEARERVAGLLNARAANEIIFTRGATEGINLVAHSFVRPRLRPDDEILITAMEHHSNIVPWQMLCKETGATLRVAPINDDGELIFEEYERLLGPRTKFVSMVQVSNALGTVNPVKEMIAAAHQREIPVLVDGAQAVSHQRVDVRDLDADFYVLSGHKLFGPTGIGALHGKMEHLKAMPPYQGGGDMILSVTFEKTTYAPVPQKFEAGTPHISGAIGLGVAIDYLEHVGLDAIEHYEHDLLNYATQALLTLPHLRLIGTARNKVSVLSFVVEGVHPHDMATIMDRCGVAVRAGHHCAQPVMDRFGVPATTRASLAFYNTKEEIDTLVDAVRTGIEMFR